MSSLVIPVTGGVGPVISGGVGSHIERVIDRLTSAVLWDFNDPTGSLNPYDLQTRIRSFDLGTVERTQGFFEPGGSDIDSVTDQREGRVRAQWIIRCSAPSYDSLRLALGELHKLLRYNQVFHHQPDGQAEPLYLDTLPAPVITPLLRGQGLALERLVVRKFEDIEYLVSVWRQAALRSPELDPAVNKLANSTLLLDSDGGGVPDGLTAYQTPALPTIVAASSHFQFDVNQQGEGYYFPFVTGVAPGETWTVSCDARVISGSYPFRLYAEFWSGGGALTSFDATSTSADWVRLSATGTAPATTTQIRVYLLSSNTGSGSGALASRFAQLEKASTASAFRVGSQAMTLDPSVA